MNISENEENKKANPVNNPHPLYPLQKSYVHCVHNMYCVHISAGTGFKKEVYIQSLTP